MDERLRKLERLAQQGDPEALARLRAANRRLSDPSQDGPEWRLFFRKLGEKRWYLVSARKRGGRLLQGADIPEHVRDWTTAAAQVSLSGWRIGSGTNILERLWSGDKSALGEVAATVTLKMDGTPCITIVTRISPPVKRKEPPELDLDNADVFEHGYYGVVRDPKRKTIFWGLVYVDDEHHTSRIYAEEFRSARLALAAARAEAMAWEQDD